MFHLEIRIILLKTLNTVYEFRHSVVKTREPVILVTDNWVPLISDRSLANYAASMLQMYTVHCRFFSGNIN